MTATTTTRQSQHLTALSIANRHRLARAALRASVADPGAEHDVQTHAQASAQALAAILEAPPACVLGARLDGVLRWAHRIGPVQARRCALQALSRLYPDTTIDRPALTTQLLYKQIGRLTARERGALASILLRLGHPT